jgi:pimeloyl-ACP methyl ester carboxylesterase
MAVGGAGLKRNSTSMYIPIGGIEQWVQFSEDHGENPILLYLHGGPGGTSVPAAAAWRSWEQDFTVVHWDQRGAGRTFKRNGPQGCGPLSLHRIVEDGLELTEYLLANLKARSLLVVGHSWGSAVGIHMLKRRPELFAAYVGTGQVVNMGENERVNYRRYLELARRRMDTEALRALQEIGPPPFRDWEAIKAVREWADRLADGEGDAVQPRPTPIAPDFTRDDVPAMLEGAEYSRRQLFGELMSIDLPSLGTSFGVPMFCFHGTCDQQTPCELAEQYFGRISAPHKEFVPLEGCHHFVVMNRPDLFRELLVNRVRPWLSVVPVPH